MNLLDIGIVALVGLAALGGYRAGLLARALSWAGLLLGLWVGARLVADVVEQVGAVPEGRLVAAAGVLLFGAFVGQAIGLWLGARLNVGLPGLGRQADRVGGAVAGGLSVLVVLWLLLPGLSSVPGELARQTRGSVIAGVVSEVAPRPPDTLQALRRLVGDSPFPQVFDGLQQAFDTGPPPEETGIDEAILADLARSTVRVEGPACGRFQEGSGFVVAPGLVVTNAHVVAGERETRLVTRTGAIVAAIVVHFDAERDLALLQASLDLAPLVVGESREGGIGAVLGYPGGGPLEISPYEVRQILRATGRDLYDDRSTERRVLVLAADLRPGDSGAALVNRDGEVVGVAFAIAPDRAGTAYALHTDELRAALAADRSGEVHTGDCLG